MTHPLNVSRPEGISIETFGDDEKGDKLTEFVKFVVGEDVSEGVVTDFMERLKEECPDWDVGGGSSPCGARLIELHTVHQDLSDVTVPSEVLDEHLEAEAEYYKNQFEAETDY